MIGVATRGDRNRQCVLLHKGIANRLPIGDFLLHVFLRAAVRVIDPVVELKGLRTKATSSRIWQVWLDWT